MRFLGLGQDRYTHSNPRNGTGPVSTLYKEGCGIEQLAPERRGPHPASEEGRLELTEALRSNDRS